METLINRGYKFKIVPTKEQKEFFLQSFGCARKIYNMYVDELYRKLEETGYQNGVIKKSELHLSKYTDFSRQFDYMKNVDAQCLSSAKMDFNNAIKKFNTEYDKKTYTKRSRKREKTLGIKPTFRDLKGMPKFRSIKKNDFSYRTYNQSLGCKWNLITLENSMLKIPKLKTLIKVKQHRTLPENSIIKNCTISMDNKGVFYASLCVEYTIDIKPKKSEKILGLDYSQHDFYVDSNGKKANYPHYYRKSEEKLKKLQRELSRKQLKSNNWYRQKQRITTLQRHIANQSLPSNVYVGTHRYWSIVSQRWGTYGAVFIFPINTDKYNFTLTKNPIIPTSDHNITVDNYDVIVNPGYVDVQFKVGNIGDTVTCVFNVTPK